MEFAFLHKCRRRVSTYVARSGSFDLVALISGMAFGSPAKVFLATCSERIVALVAHNYRTPTSGAIVRARSNVTPRRAKAERKIFGSGF
jgi:hypothetical protein